MVFRLFGALLAAAYADSCHDKADGRTDNGGDGCGWYTEKRRTDMLPGRPDACGSYDDEDFAAGEVCCACGGGDRGAVASALTFSGLAVWDAEASTVELEQGIASTLARTYKRFYQGQKVIYNVVITGFRSDGRPDLHPTVIDFQVTVPAHHFAAALENAFASPAFAEEVLPAIRGWMYTDRDSRDDQPALQSAWTGAGLVEVAPPVALKPGSTMIVTRTTTTTTTTTTAEPTAAHSPAALETPADPGVEEAVWNGILEEQDAAAQSFWQAYLTVVLVVLAIVLCCECGIAFAIIRTHHSIKKTGQQPELGIISLLLAAGGCFFGCWAGLLALCFPVDRGPAGVVVQQPVILGGPTEQADWPEDPKGGPLNRV